MPTTGRTRPTRSANWCAIGEARPKHAVTPPIETDALVIGAGPVGLFQAFQLGLLEIKACIVDALPRIGGQCVELYGDKPIYDIPSVHVCTGRELADRLLRQLAPFDVPMHLGEVVTALDRQADGRFRVRTQRGAAAASTFLCKTVFIAAGMGAFLPRTLKLDGLDQFEGTQLFYRADVPDVDVTGKHLVVLGGDEGAVDAAIAWVCDDATDAQPAAVTLVHRRAVLDASADKLARVQALHEAGRLRFLTGQVTGFEVECERLVALRVTDPGAQIQTLRTDVLMVLLGLSPKLGVIAEWGLALQRKQLVVDTECFATSEPGIFAVGDVNTYPGKKKLIVCGFHEATLAAWGAAPIVFPKRNLALQYTTTSPRLHRLLGVAAANA